RLLREKVAGANHSSTSSLTLAGAEIREDHLCIERAMHPYTGGVLTTSRQQKAAGGDRRALRRGLARLLGAYPLLEDRIARLGWRIGSPASISEPPRGGPD